MSEVYYSISAGNSFDGKSICLWRQKGVTNTKIARFTNPEAAKLFAEEFHFPLSSKVKKALQEQADE